MDQGLSTKKPLSIDSLCQHYLEQLFINTPQNLYQIPNDFQTEHTKACLSYGQIMYLSLEKIYSAIPISEDDVIVEFGSGIGQTALQFLLRTPAKRVIGVELATERFEFSKKIEAKITQELDYFFLETGKKLKFVNGDFLKYRLNDATILFMDATCFSFKMMLAIRKQILQSESLNYVLSLKRIPDLNGFRCIKTISTECSWGTGRCYIYRRN